MGHRRGGSGLQRVALPRGLDPFYMLCYLYTSIVLYAELKRFSAFCTPVLHRPKIVSCRLFTSARSGPPPMGSAVYLGLWVKGERGGERERGDQAQTVVAAEGLTDLMWEARWGRRAMCFSQRHTGLPSRPSGGGLHRVTFPRGLDPLLWGARCTWVCG